MRTFERPSSLLVAMFLLSGCGAIVASPTAPASSSAAQDVTGVNHGSGEGGGIDYRTLVPDSQISEHAVLIATSKSDSIEVWDQPGGTITSTITAADVLTAPDETSLTFLVKSQQADWYEVYLPVRPNGSAGWVRGSQVTLTGTDYAIDVFVADHVLVVNKAGEEQARFPVGVGRTDRPTPGGVYFLRELLIPPDPTDVYGRYAYGLSGYSPVLDSFRGGDAVIGLHGTNEPASIGGDVSSGCLRMNNADITTLVETFGLPLGTPVYIHD
ncbi:MAG: L,D-transpeptidase [Demequinaceae bacterium]|nr:L,D-transpeptidase [Demequinaceae bacterium]